jgi:hypothetical protein
MSRVISEATQQAHKAVAFDTAGNLVEAERCYTVPARPFSPCVPPIS